MINLRIILTLYSFLITANILSQEIDDLQKELFYCREDLSLTAVYPGFEGELWATNWANVEITENNKVRVRNAQLILIGKDGLTKDSLTFRSSIQEVIAIDPKEVILLGFDFIYTLSIRDNKISILERIENILSIKEKILVAQGKIERSNSSPKSKSDFKRLMNFKSKEIRLMNLEGKSSNFLIFSFRKKENIEYTFYNLNSKKFHSLQIPSPLENKVLKDVFKKIRFSDRNIFFPSDQEIIIDNPVESKLILYNTKLNSIVEKNYPNSIITKGSVFYTYDYQNSKEYFIKVRNNKYEILLIKETGLIKLATLTEFDNLIIGGKSILSIEEKTQNKGNVICFYATNLYPSLFK